MCSTISPIVKNTFVDLESSQDLENAREVQSEPEWEPDWTREDASDVASEVVSDVSSSVDHNIEVASSSTQLPVLILKPASLKKDLGDERFHWNKKKKRQHVCDACCDLFKYGSQAHEFDGQYVLKLPVASPRSLERMYWRGEHDFTWVCTFCQYEASDFTDIDEFRKFLGIE